jgi:hypothetical protein
MPEFKPGTVVKLPSSDQLMTVQQVRKHFLGDECRTIQCIWITEGLLRSGEFPETVLKVVELN